MEKRLSSTNEIGASTFMGMKRNLDLNFIPYIKMNSNMIIDLNIKYTTIKLLEDSIREKIFRT